MEGVWREFGGSLEGVWREFGGSCEKLGGKWEGDFAGRVGNENEEGGASENEEGGASESEEGGASESEEGVGVGWSSWARTMSSRLVPSPSPPADSRGCISSTVWKSDSEDMVRNSISAFGCRPYR